jgi:hypothetical protein
LLQHRQNEPPFKVYAAATAAALFVGSGFLNNGDNPPNIAFLEEMSGSIDGEALHKNSWKSTLQDKVIPAVVALKVNVPLNFDTSSRGSVSTWY